MREFRALIRYLNIGKSRHFPAPRRFRRQIRTSYSILLVLCLLTAYAGASSLVYGGTKSAAISFATLGVLGIVALLHRAARHRTARVLTILSVNLAIFGISYFIPTNSNVSMFLLAFVGLPVIMMSWRESRFWMAFCSALPLVLWTILLVTNYGNGVYNELDPAVTKPFGYAHSFMVFALVMIEFLYYDGITQSYARAMRRSLRAEERANRAKTTFLRSMSHEMRTPLGAVLGAVDLLDQQYGANKDLKRLSTIIGDAGENLLQLTEKSMAYARITSGAVKPELGPADPLSLIDPVIERYREMISRKDINLEISKSNHNKVLVDPAMFTEVMAQIVDNAVTYTPDRGSVRVCIRDGAGGNVRLMVTDTGPGIPAQKHQDVFKPYERLDQTYGSKSGSGVGLTIARSYVRAMKGDIGLDGDVESGARIWIEIPAA